MSRYYCSANIFDRDLETDTEVWEIVNADSIESAVVEFCYICDAIVPGTYTVRVESYERPEVKVFKANVNKTVFVSEDDE